MIKYAIFLILFFPIAAFCQTDKLGLSKSDVIKSMQGNPCKSDYNQIWYCGDNGSLINYTFKNNLVSSVLYMWEFKSKYEAESDVKSEVTKTENIYGRPERKGVQSFWFTGDEIIMIAYGFTNGKHYSCWRVSER
jgi:hypothetical protein